MSDHLQNFRLDDRVALVTGAARGLGAQIAEALASVGARVMLTDVLTDALEATTEALATADAKVAFRRHDVTQEADWVSAMQATLTRFGRLDVVVNNAGIETAALFADCELVDFRRTMAINVDGVFLGIKHAVRAMRPGGGAGRGGSIVNLSSAAGLVGVPTLGAYCASKGAVRLMTKAAAVECARLGYGIRVNSVHPGIVKTEMGSNVVRNFARLGLAPDEAAADAFISSMHPLGYGQPADVAHAVIYLASNASRWTTGAEIVLDGGATAI
jgi:NAD(P)-dependent dehydrogenase (short-subunit alcohol dehydrogenase family)